MSVCLFDDSHASVVDHSLSNRFSVVTGAPGTGKTQVILNIIANALLKDKSVLVASKINKAVDNVKERFDIIDSSQYLLRFGNKEYVRNQTVPALTQIQNRINASHHQQEDSSSFSSVLSQYQQAISSRKDAEKKLARIEELKLSLPQLISEKSALEAQIHEEQRRYTESLEAIRTKYSDVSDLGNISMHSVSNVLKDITRFRNELQVKYSGLSGIWHNLISKKKHANHLLREIENLPQSVNARLRNNYGTYSVNDLENGNAIIEYANQVIALLNRISDWRHTLYREDHRHFTENSKLNSSLSLANQKYGTAASEYEVLTAKKSELKNLINRTKDLLFNLGPQLVAAKIVEIENDKTASQKIEAYKTYLSNLTPWRTEDVFKFIIRSKEFLSVCRLNSVTSLSIKSGFPLTDNLFDLLIIDEASQCDVASALPLILRAKQVVIIGDPMQLRHITSVNTEEENEIREHFGLSSREHPQYVNQSLWDYSAAFLNKANENSSPIMLENHYRCHHDIIGYSNHQFYRSTPLNPMTDESNMTLPQKGMVMINIRGEQESDNVNINRKEAERAVLLAKELLTLKADVTIGIVTPFRDQADYINTLMDDALKEKIEVNTAYGFQGDERDVMIYSTVVTDNSPKRKINWIDNGAPNLVNVAVTRARQTLYIVGNADYIKRASLANQALGNLIRYAESKTK